GDGAQHTLDGDGNDVDVIASNTGSVSYSDVNDVRVGTVTLPDSDTEESPEGVAVTGMTDTGDLSLTADKLTIDEAISAGGDTTLTADEIDVQDKVSGDGQLTLKQRTPGLDIHLGGADDETIGNGDPLHLSGADLAWIEDGFDRVAIGDGSTRR